MAERMPVRGATAMLSLPARVNGWHFDCRSAGGWDSASSPSLRRDYHAEVAPIDIYATSPKNV